jgi:hypothetical protein
VETRNYAEFGFADGRTGNPNQAWEALRVLAAQRGVIRDGTALNLPWPKVEKRIQEIRRLLREHFHISSDPIPFVESKVLHSIRAGRSQLYRSRKGNGDRKICHPPTRDRPNSRPSRSSAPQILFLIFLLIE